MGKQLYYSEYIQKSICQGYVDVINYTQNIASVNSKVNSNNNRGREQIILRVHKRLFS